MPGRRLSAAEVERRLQRCRDDYDQLVAKVADIGFICEGSLNEVRSTCGNPNCRCADPANRHGPYWQLTWKQAGKTVTRQVSADEAALYREWINNRRELTQLIARMQQVSRRAGTVLLAQMGHDFHGPDRPPARRSTR